MQKSKQHRTRALKALGLAIRSRRLDLSMSGCFRLSRGSVMMKAESKAIIVTPHATVSVRPGSIVLLTATADLTRVRDIVDNCKDGIVVTIGRYSHRLLPGKEVSISTRRHRPLSAMLSDGIARRRISETTAGEFAVVTADYSIMDAMTKHPLLKTVRLSAAKSDQTLTKEIEKITAILSVLIDREAGPYYEPKIAPDSAIAASPDERVY